MCMKPGRNGRGNLIHLILSIKKISDHYVVKGIISMKRVILTSLGYIVILLFLIQGIGCGTAKSVYRNVTPGKGVLKKRVLVMPLLDQAGVGEEKASQITATLVDLLNEDEHLLVHKGINPSPSSQTVRSPEFGVVIDSALIKNADEMGMNVLIVGVLNPFERTARRWGIWPLRKTRRELEISVSVSAVDLIDGTLLLTHLETRKRKTSTDDPGWELGKTKIDEDRLEKELSDILEDQASNITEELRDQPWRGKVISADGQSIVINAGKDIGLTNGSVFEVFEKGESVRSLNGRQFHLLGPKVGEIETVKVMDSYATAVPLTEGQFEAGQEIRTKN